VPPCNPPCCAGYRLVNGEGDGLPGLVIDVYSDTAVIKLDGDGPAAFYSAEGLAAWLRTQLDLQCVYLKNRCDCSCCPPGGPCLQHAVM
jgi:23S rRNA (cytosine1962-C5)-methyltransferase